MEANGIPWSFIQAIRHVMSLLAQGGAGTFPVNLKGTM